MKAKPKATTFRLTAKNRSYLEKLGMIDPRTGRKNKTTEADISPMLNAAITTYLEQGKHITMIDVPAWMLRATHVRNLIKLEEEALQVIAKRIKALYEELEMIPGLDDEWLKQQEKFDIVAKHRKEARESRPAPVFHRQQASLSRFRQNREVLQQS